MHELELHTIDASLASAYISVFVTFLFVFESMANLDVFYRRGSLQFDHEIFSLADTQFILLNVRCTYEFSQFIEKSPKK